MKSTTSLISFMKNTDSLKHKQHWRSFVFIGLQSNADDHQLFQHSVSFLLIHHLQPAKSIRISYYNYLIPIQSNLMPNTSIYKVLYPIFSWTHFQVVSRRHAHAISTRNMYYQSRSLKLQVNGNMFLFLWKIIIEFLLLMQQNMTYEDYL